MPINKRDDHKNYYEILDVPANATPKEIHEAYVKAKNAYTGDSVAMYSLMTPEECKSMLHHVEESYTVLCSPDKRNAYNKARGISSMQTTTMTSLGTESASMSSSFENPGHISISKITAQNRFKLTYTPNPEFEKEIENTTIFTGDFLRKIREYKNISIERMADLTKVSRTNIMNIESDNKITLPALAYVRGYVYQYAKCLRLNEAFVATSYINHLKTLP